MTEVHYSISRTSTGSSDREIRRRMGEKQGVQRAQRYLYEQAGKAFAAHDDTQARALRETADLLNVAALKAEEEWHKYAELYSEEPNPLYFAVDAEGDDTFFSTGAGIIDLREKDVVISRALYAWLARVIEFVHQVEHAGNAEKEQADDAEAEDDV